MPSSWHEKKERLAREQFEKDLQSAPDDTTTAKFDMGDGEEELFEKKLSKEEKKALAKAKREAKRKKKKSGSEDGGDGDGDGDDNEQDDDKQNRAVAKAAQILSAVELGNDTSAGGTGASGGGGAVDYDDGIDHETADALAAAGTICTFSRSRKAVDARSRDINVTNFTLQHMGAIMLDETEIILNHGNRYGLIGRNGCGKSTLLKALGARAVPIPRR